MEQKTQSQSKKIMYLITKSNFGGAQKYVYELALEAVRRGHNVSVALGGDGLLCTKLQEAGITVYPIKSLGRDIKLSSELKSFFEIIALLRKIKPDVLHVNSSKAGGVGALAGRICGIKKIIFTIHGWAFNEDRSALSKLCIKKLYWIIIFLSHTSIAVSEHTKKQAQSIPFFFLIKKKIIVIKNGIRPISFLDREFVRNFFQEKFNIHPDTKIIGTLAELHPIKGLRFLIEGVKNIKHKENIKVLILGAGEEQKKLQQHILELKLENNVILGGFLENGSLYLQGFDIFILPSLSEAMPLSILEAGSAHLPIIASRVGGIPEIIENGYSGILVSPGNSAEISNAINSLIENEALAHTFSKNITEKIENDFNVDTFYTQTFNLY